MKYYIFLIIFIFLANCSKNNPPKTNLEKYIKEAKANNCVVFENSDVTYGKSLWENFISSTTVVLQIIYEK